MVISLAILALFPWIGICGVCQSQKIVDADIENTGQCTEDVNGDVGIACFVVAVVSLADVQLSCKLCLCQIPVFSQCFETV